MGRLIDLDKVEFLEVDGNIEFNRGVDCCVNRLLKQPLVEAIPKADYENRLKADLAAMLTELKTEIEEIPNSYEHKPIGTYDYCSGAENERKVNLEIIQQKINALKGGEQ